MNNTAHAQVWMRVLYIKKYSLNTTNLYTLIYIVPEDLREDL